MKWATIVPTVFAAGLLGLAGPASASLVQVPVGTSAVTITIDSGNIVWGGNANDQRRTQRVLVQGANVHLGTYLDGHGATQGLAGKLTSTRIADSYDPVLDADIVMDAEGRNGTVPYHSTLTFDLGSVMTIAAMQIWNCNWDAPVWSSHPYTDGLQSFVLKVSDNGTAWTTLNGGTALPLARLTTSSTTYLGETYTFSGTQATALPDYLGDTTGGISDYSGVTVSGRYIRFDNLTHTNNNGWGEKVFLQAVQFYTPEPATLALLASGLGMLVLRRRCR